MLVIYKPNQPDDIDMAYNHILSHRRYYAKLDRCESGNEIAMSMSWCRELSTTSLQSMLEDAPPGVLNIYGIRKHGNVVANQPRNCPGNIKRPTEYTDKTFSSLFQLTVELVSCILDGNVMSPSEVACWSRRWSLINSDIGHRPQMELEPKCILNYDEHDVPETRFWVDNGMFGTITGIPSHWAKSTPIMSYLLYIPRLWGAFYTSPRMLTKMSKMSHRRRSVSPVIMNIMGSFYDSERRYKSSLLWTYMANRLMLPLWFTSHGKEHFWTFTYMLIREALSETFHYEGIPNLVDLLYASERNGFVSWCTKLARISATPSWFKLMLDELARSGPSAMFNFGTVASYV